MTEVTVTVIVENVTLSEEEVTEIFNIVPVQKLESYFPSQLFTQEVKKPGVVGQSRHRQMVRHRPLEN